MQYGFSLDPLEILGLGPNASLQELRDAYLEKVKRHHPDKGGDVWAFRVVCQAYEILGTARVAGRAASEAARPAPSPPPRAPTMRPPTAKDAESRSEWTRAGIRDVVDDPARLVEVELFLLRYALTDPMQYLLTAPQDRVLSCNLNVSWPGKSHVPGRDDAAILALVSEAFAPLAKKTRAIRSQAHVEDGIFTGWLSYADEAKVKDALKALHKACLDKGLGIDQWSREMILPREGR